MLQKLFSLFVSVLLGACSAIAPQPTSTPIPTQTPLPTETPIPTDTPIPTATDTPEPTPTEDIMSSLVPVGEPASEWNGIPIMPEAIAGEGDTGAYRFTIQASREEIQAYYTLELPKLGWRLFTVGQGETGASDRKSVV